MSVSDCVEGSLVEPLGEFVVEPDDGPEGEVSFVVSDTDGVLTVGVETFGVVTVGVETSGVVAVGVETPVPGSWVLGT